MCNRTAATESFSAGSGSRHTLTCSHAAQSVPVGPFCMMTLSFPQQPTFAIMPFYWPARRCRGVFSRAWQQAGLWQRRRSVMVEHFTAVGDQIQKFSLQPFLFFRFTGPLFNTGSWLFFQLFPPEVRLLCSVKTAFLFFVNLHFIGALFNSTPINTGSLWRREKKPHCGHIWRGEK